LAAGPVSWALPGFAILVAAELAVPVWAERAAPTTWHAHHISERYGLFTIIVLGESILAATLAVQAALASGERLLVLAPIIVGGLLIVYVMWWLYFYRAMHDLLRAHDLRKAIAWGYGHFAVFASAAAVGAGLAVAVDEATGQTTIGAGEAAAAVAIPVAIYVAALWALHYRAGERDNWWLGPSAAAATLAAPLAGRAAVPLVGILMASLLAAKLVRR
jgi:low temperature requirement protein LtrA